MILKICSIRDSKAEAWLNPMCFQSNGQAVRSFSDAVNQGEGEIKNHPEDYALFELGEFDQRSGEIVLCEAPEVLALGVNLLQEVSGDEAPKPYAVTG